ncbi:hypothetical protein [Pokkaliibacter plantistimulans]|uniref:hypothetical protein n=1 Tax=Pokkaliibacter plantistimulans TaxID=1635171 RepID=UPI001402E812
MRNMQIPENKDRYGIERFDRQKFPNRRQALHLCNRSHTSQDNKEMQAIKPIV